MNDENEGAPELPPEPAAEQIAEPVEPVAEPALPPPPVAPALEDVVQDVPVKPGWTAGMKLGLAYFVDPLGRMLGNWENVAVNGQPLRENYSETLFDKMSEDAHKGNSFAKYAGAGIGIGAGAAALAIASIPYATMAAGTFTYDMYKTFVKRDRPEPEEGVYTPSFGDGLKGGFGIGVDPAGFFLENIERNMVNGKGVDDNRIKSVTQILTKDARQGNSVAKYVGGVLGFGGGALVSTITFGLVPVGTGIYDVVASIRNKK